jgi:hypothetical protein
MIMTTIFDLLSVVCFAGTALAFFRLSDRTNKTLIQLMAPALAFAIGNQLGNTGYTAFALILILAGASYVALVFRHNPH